MTSTELAKASSRIYRHHRNKATYDLCPKHASGRNFGVVTQLEIAREIQSIREYHTPVGLEHNHGYRFSRNHKPSYQL